MPIAPINSNIHYRKSIRLKEYDYSYPGEYFVTICTKGKECMYGSIANGKMDLNEKGRIVDRCWKGIPEHFPYVDLDEYAIMPNHFHGIIIINENNCCSSRGEVTSPLHKPTLGNIVDASSPLRKRTLGNIVAYFKYQSTKMINELQSTAGVKVWQRNYYDRIVRNEKELQNMQDYIVNNVISWAFEKEHPENIPL
jgi:putative transposase